MNIISLILTQPYDQNAIVPLFAQKERLRHRMTGPMLVGQQVLDPGWDLDSPSLEPSD